MRQPFGHAAQPWRTFHILNKLERALGNAAEAHRAHDLARDHTSPTGAMAAKARTRAGEFYDLMATNPEAAKPQLVELSQSPDLPTYLQALLSALQAVAAGSRDPALADEPSLDFDDAAELLLLIEKLTRRDQGPSAAPGNA